MVDDRRTKTGDIGVDVGFKLWWGFKSLDVPWTPFLLIRLGPNFVHSMYFRDGTTSKIRLGIEINPKIWEAPRDRDIRGNVSKESSRLGDLVSRRTEKRERVRILDYRPRTCGTPTRNEIYCLMGLRLVRSTQRRNV